MKIDDEQIKRVGLLLRRYADSREGVLMGDEIESAALATVFDKAAATTDEERWAAVGHWCQWNFGDSSWAYEIRDTYDDPEAAIEALRELGAEID